MTSEKIYFGKPCYGADPLDGLDHASAVLQALAMLIGDSADLSDFQRNEKNRSIDGLAIILDSTHHAIETAAADIRERAGQTEDAGGPAVVFSRPSPDLPKTLGDLRRATAGAVAAIRETGEPKLTEEAAGESDAPTEEKPKQKKRANGN